MQELLNTLYVQTQGAVLHLDSDTVRVEVGAETKLRAPLLRLCAIVVFGEVTITPALIRRCAADGRSLVWLTYYGQFRARVEGPVRGNVLLRQAQHQALNQAQRTVHIARQIIAAKVQNSRQVVLRAARDSDEASRTPLTKAAATLAEVLTSLPTMNDLNALRGAEGTAARAYFGVFGHMLRADDPVLRFDGRNRRPPRDPANAVLSLLYGLLRGDCAAALEGVGLDPQVGYLHALRSGRPALALDLMEELRPVLADRTAITLINRKQLQEKDFQRTPGAGVRLTDDGRKKVLTAYEERKKDQVQHRVLKQKAPLGLVPHLQARLLARYLRTDLEAYPPFLFRS